MRPDPIHRLAGVLGVVAVVVGLALIWLARGQVARSVYVSELGAADLPTAAVFEIALLCVASGGLAVAYAASSLGSRLHLVVLATPMATLVVASVCFAIASQVTCSPGCPLPLTPGAGLQDLVHTSSAVLGFAAACFAMLQVGFSRGSRALAACSLMACLLVAGISATGGILSLARFATSIGAMLEFIGATVALVWLAGLGTALVGARFGEAEFGVARFGAARLGAATFGAARSGAGRSGAATTVGL